jgi:hypothetical protein
MIFDTRQRLALAVIHDVAKLIKLDTDQDECPVTAFAFKLTLLQAQVVHDPLEEQLDGFFAVTVQVVLPRAMFFRQLLGREDPAAGLRVKVCVGLSSRARRDQSESGCEPSAYCASAARRLPSRRRPQAVSLSPKSFHPHRLHLFDEN